MKTVDYIKMSFEMSRNWIMGLAVDMKDSPLTQPTPHGGNHPLWCVGHLAYSEANLVQTVARGKPNPLAEWKKLFDGGTTAETDPNAYPSFDELLQKFDEVRAATMAYLDTLSDEDLEAESHAEGEMKEWFGTVAACLAAVPVHVGFHGGQIADARRAAGRPVLMG
ncbi:MAG: DinB family protein [Planctomycetota bacterium]